MKKETTEKEVNMKKVALIAGLTRPFLFGPLCNVEKRVWPTFIWVCLIFIRTFENFGPLFLTFGPLLFSKPGQRKRGNTNVCRHRGPLSHFFLLLNVIKKYNKYI